MTLVPSLLIPLPLPVPQMGGCVAFAVFNADLSLDAAVLGLVGDHVVERCTFTASLVEMHWIVEATISKFSSVSRI